MIQKPRGTIDILPEDSVKWQYIEETIRRICRAYGYGEIRLPTFEATELFARGIGDSTDVVQKEMYSFEKENRNYTLRPEGTANVMRSVIENTLYGDALPVKLYYLMNCFRYEKPQAGRLREYTTFGIEQIGSVSPVVDAEVISLAESLIKKLGITGVALHINSIGCMADGCRSYYHKILKEYLSGNYGELCDTCKSRLERNATRVLDCKSEACQKVVASAPKHKDYICAECKDHFDALQSYLKALGIGFTVNPLIVRGLDYYTKTVFEFISENIESLGGALVGGGRYDGLSEIIGGPLLPGIGFGMGLNRLVMELENSGHKFPAQPKPAVYIAALPDARETSAALVKILREAGIYAETDNMERSLKAQMKYADKTGAEFVYVIGSDEVEKRSAVLKNMRTSEQLEAEFDKLIEILKGAAKI